MHDRREFLRNSASQRLAWQRGRFWVANRPAERAVSWSPVFQSPTAKGAKADLGRLRDFGFRQRSAHGADIRQRGFLGCDLASGEILLGPPPN